MNPLFIRSATVLHPGSPFNNQQIDLIIRDGVILKTGRELAVPEGADVVDAAGKYLSPGFFDLNATFGEPGRETREDLDTGVAAAAAGGFTGVALMPNTTPPLHSKTEIAYIVNKNRDQAVAIHPIGAISHQLEGKDLAELYDMYLGGAIAYSDGNRPIADSGLMSRAMLYVKSFDGLIFSYAEDASLAGKGRMNEGKISTWLGMKGIPALAEEIMVARDIYLAEYNDSRVHFSTISTAQSVELIRKAKKKGLKVTCDVAAHHLVLTEDELVGFDSHYKVKPPLRTEQDVNALRDGLEDNTIDAVVSQHLPHEKEFKNIEFEIASYGITALQTVLPLLLRAGLSPEKIVDKLCTGPRKILGLPLPGLAVGELADLVLFDTEREWTFDETTNRSKSSNSPFMGSMLVGRAVMIVSRGKCIPLI